MRNREKVKGKSGSNELEELTAQEVLLYTECLPARQSLLRLLYSIGLSLDFIPGDSQLEILINRLESRYENCKQILLNNKNICRWLISGRPLPTNMTSNISLSLAHELIQRGLVLAGDVGSSINTKDKFTLRLAESLISSAKNAISAVSSSKDMLSDKGEHKEISEEDIERAIGAYNEN